MRTAVWLLVQVCVLFLAGMAVEAAEPKVALVVGNSAYQDLPAIKSADADADTMAKTLEAAGFKVVRASNTTKGSFAASLKKFTASLTGSDIGVLYYSGHSVQIAGQNRIVPVDATASGLDDGTIGLNDVLAAMKGKAARSIVIFDACRELDVAPGDIQAGCAKQRVSSGMLVVLAAEPGLTIAGDSMLASGLISRACEPNKDINAALAEARQDIIEKSEGGQVLYYNSALSDGVTSLDCGAGPENITQAPEPPPVEPQPEPEPQPQPEQPKQNTAGACDGCPEMVAIAAGSFEMGNPKGDAREKPVRTVSIKEFSMARNEVTVGQRRKCMEAGKCRDVGKSGLGDNDGIPVRNVTWSDAAGYAEWISAETGQSYRLPSEAEWEYAARAGSNQTFSGSDEASIDFVDCKNCGGTHKNPAPRSDLQPNGFGLSGMSGGVAEWVLDCWHPSYEKSPADGTAFDAPNCTKRVLRGGSWRDDQKHVTVTSRAYYDFDVAYPNNGFRVARDP